MKIENINGKEYRLPGSLNKFQRKLFIHLINWKWKHITNEPGSYVYKGKTNYYDAILPDPLADNFPQIYPIIKPELKSHLDKYPFTIHKFFNHMASSQAANINLFLPILLHPMVDKILGKVKSDFKNLAKTSLDKGYRIEYFDENNDWLNDKTKVSGTDSDIGIAYFNHNDELCLWLIEHKLQEAEFTSCGGAKSKGRKPSHNCNMSFNKILQNKAFCYYHSARKYEYWNITENNKSLFNNITSTDSCPFKNGVNQLWRNQLLAMSIENSKKFKEVTFSVVRHPENRYLDRSISQYKEIIGNSKKFSVHSSKEFINSASNINDKDLNSWINWYKDLYLIN